MFGTGFETRTGLTLKVESGWKLVTFSQEKGQYGNQLVVQLTKETVNGNTITKTNWVPIPNFEKDDNLSDADLLKAQRKFVDYAQNFVRGFNLEVSAETFEKYVELLLNSINQFIGKEVEVLLIPPLKWNNVLKKWQLKITDNKECYTTIPKSTSTQDNFIRIIGSNLPITISAELQALYKEMLSYNQSFKDKLKDENSEVVEESDYDDFDI